MIGRAGFTRVPEGGAGRSRHTGSGCSLRPAGTFREYL